MNRRLEPPDGERRACHRGRRIVLGLAAAVVLIVGAAAGLYLLADNIGDNVARVPDVFGPLAGSARPADRAR